jgi:hypothetical protein
MQPGIESKNATNGEMKETSIANIDVADIVIMEALRVMATQPTDSPYVVLGHPPKNAPAIEPIPSPRRVR